MTPLVALIIGVHAWGIIPEMGQHDTQPDYYDTVLPYVFSCDGTDLPYTNTNPIHARNQIKWWVQCQSFTWFSNAKAIPLIFNIAVMPLVYLLGYYTTNDRIIGLVALAAFINNPLYTDWQGNGTYDQIWSFFLLLSVVLLFKSRLSPLSYVLSILSKALAIAYLPMWLYTHYTVRRSKKELGIILGLVASSIILLSMSGNIVGAPVGIFPEHLDQALFRNISLLWQVIPFMMALGGINTVFHAKVKPQNKRLVIVWMIGIILVNPLIHIFSDQLTFSYRFVPLAAFMSVFAGMVIVEAGNFITETKLRITSKPDEI